MIVVTTEKIEGYQVKEIKGPAFGLIVRSRGLGGDIMAGLKGLVGGEIKQYTSMLEDSRKEAMDRMIRNATAMGANAIIMMRFDSGEIGQNMSEIVAYGTAAVVEKL
ncbi:YbjQ family protein [Bacillus sp. FJAT-27245]|uniref:YbjQ family protein n=1 Tax=Bacillus sp. FJAT-27245 TaxID=1684144 RepID=UPI0006A7DB99|nr:heavy metal-binding domain-containing protein [Bacillus sp. FJAT-27245]